MEVIIAIMGWIGELWNVLISTPTFLVGISIGGLLLGLLMYDILLDLFVGFFVPSRKDIDNSMGFKRRRNKRLSKMKAKIRKKG